MSKLKMPYLKKIYIYFSSSKNHMHIFNMLVTSVQSFKLKTLGVTDYTHFYFLGATDAQMDRRTGAKQNAYRHGGIIKKKETTHCC